MSNLLTPADLAERMDATEENILRWRLAYRWPSVKVGRNVRFTEDQYAEIVAMQSATPAKKDSAEPVEVVGQTARSARRSRAS